MRTDIVLDHNRVRAAFKHSDAKTKRDLIELTLQEFVANRCRKSVRAVIDTVEIDRNRDYKTLRTEQN